MRLWFMLLCSGFQQNMEYWSIYTEKLMLVWQNAQKERRCFVLTFAQRPCLVAFQNLRSTQGAINTLQHLIFQAGGCCNACLADSPKSSSETNLWKQNKLCWSTSPWDTVQPHLPLSQPTIQRRKLHKDKCTKTSDNLLWGRNTERKHVVCKQANGEQKPRGRGGKLTWCREFITRQWGIRFVSTPNQILLLLMWDILLFYIHILE